jgi:hypothetical protein
MSTPSVLQSSFAVPSSSPGIAYWRAGRLSIAGRLVPFGPLAMEAGR